jgi:hypothetical protein
MTDDAPVYWPIGGEFSGHGTVNYSAEEYVRAAFWHTNTVENFFSIFKRGIYGCYFHVSETHLHRYAAEFDFRHNNRIALGIDDLDRADRALVGARNNCARTTPDAAPLLIACPARGRRQKIRTNCGCHSTIDRLGRMLRPCRASRSPSRTIQSSSSGSSTWPARSRSMKARTRSIARSNECSHLELLNTDGVAKIQSGPGELRPIPLETVHRDCPPGRRIRVFGRS